MPVVATPIPEVELLRQCRIAADSTGFIREIEDALKDPGPKAWRSQTMRNQSWEARLEEISSHIAALETHPGEDHS